MPSDKRQRQRERHQQKVAVEQIRAKRNKRIRTAIGAVVVAGAVVAVIALVSGGGSKKSPAAASTTSTPSTTTSTTTPPVAAKCPPSTGSKTRVINFTKAPPTCISPTGVYDAIFTTDVGTFTVEMHASTSLASINDVVFLARYHFYDGTIFHRVIPGFVVQGGDPTGTGTGGPGYSFTGNTPPSSCTAKKDCYATGDVAMANSGTPSSNGSQFFIVLPGGASQLTDNYSTIGHVVSGLSVVERIGQDGQSSGTPKVTHRVKSVTITQVS
ncbi:MAG TPA: peptidylprolyl isomerase [Acidimicrobiales bacterium]|nr:peptidylprolyl isomerase [Acidimicrobiales bacterium]